MSGSNRQFFGLIFYVLSFEYLNIEETASIFQLLEF